MKQLWVAIVLVCVACGDDVDPPADDAAPGDVGSADVGSDAGVRVDAGNSAALPLASFYEEAIAWRVPEGQPVFGDDNTITVEGRRIRVVEFGVGDGGFPAADSVFDVGGRLFVEVDAAGEAISNLNEVAVSIRAEDGDASERGIQCVLETGHACVVALHHVLSPSRIDPPYVNETTGEAITDSTVLQFNLLREQERGVDASGSPVAEPRIAREYVAHIARAGISLLTATGQALVHLSLAAAPPARFVVAGHSKWGGAVAQMAAFDPRVVGAFVSGWPLDWMRWLELALERWSDGLGIEMFDFVCAEPCLWSSTQEFLDYHRTPGGQDWVRQFDFRSLQEAGAFDDVAILALRNGREAHPVDTEGPLFAEGNGPDAFRFMPDEPHRFDTAEHGSVWRHWVRHVFDGAPTFDVEERLVESAGFVSLDVDGVDVRQVVLAARQSDDGTFGALDSVPDYACEGECVWSTQPMAVTDETATATLPVDGPFAYVVMVQLDDGSGDLVTLSSQVHVHP
ncbi:MAG: hypothetical protein AB8H86_19290 [Polyangiales bacterium]